MAERCNCGSHRSCRFSVCSRPCYRPDVVPYCLGWLQENPTSAYAGKIPESPPRPPPNSRTSVSPEISSSVYSERWFNTSSVYLAQPKVPLGMRIIAMSKDYHSTTEILAGHKYPKLLSSYRKDVAQAGINEKLSNYHLKINQSWYILDNKARSITS